MSKDRNFAPICGPKKWAFEANIVLISEISSKEYIEQDWIDVNPVETF